LFELAALFPPRILFVFVWCSIRDLPQLAGIFLFHERFQIAQIHFPELPVLFHPGTDGFERGRIQLIDPMTPAAGFDDQPGFSQMSQVFGNRWTGYRESLGDISGGLGPTAQQVEHGPASGIGQRVKCGLR
jgi:hypothetical protein